jgi:hypothetical protein
MFQYFYQVSPLSFVFFNVCRYQAKVITIRFAIPLWRGNSVTVFVQNKFSFFVSVEIQVVICLQI